ncbi:MAG: DUF1501 domain-containing protein [Planctomycetaceae bacterium]|nr:DUF1501 domain-containing protein [Planctomycetaceae bacterium]
MFGFVDRWAGFRDRVTRREALALGGMSALAMSGVRAHASGAVSASGGTAKRLIFLSLFGGPPHQETYDIQHEAPSELRGEFQSVPTTLPGFRICEYMPKLARLAHQYTIIRSMTHGDNGHESAYYSLMTGRPYPIPNTANAAPKSTDYPNYGSLLSYLKPPEQPVPSFVLSGGLISTHIGQTAGFLGPSWAPYVLKEDANKPGFSVPEFSLSNDVSQSRLDDRQGLLDQLNGVDRSAKRQAESGSFTTYQERVFDMLTSPRTQAAFDIEAESPATRAAYGDFPFGQNVLLARRLSEAGVPVVQINYRNRGDGGLDTHHDNFNICKGQLCPRLDGCISALLIDLEERGLLDETLVVASGEFGRTPKINHNAGRDHWGGCCSLLLAGGGIKRGYVHGSSDKIGAYPDSDPVGPWDLYATIMHCCGIDPEMTIYDNQDRPHRLCEGTIIDPVLA